MQIVHFHESNSGSVAYPAHNRGVITGWQVSNHRRFARVARSVAAVLNILDLILGDDPADDGRLPVIIGGNQSSIAIVQFQYRIGQWIGNAILTELRPNGSNNHTLWCCPLNNESANHHVVSCLHKAASADV